MKKKIVFLLMCTALILSLCGCDLLIEDKYVSVKLHEMNDDTSDQTAQVILEVNEDSDLTSLLYSLVEQGVTYGKLNFTYDGDIDSALSAACIDVSTNTPLGAYAVTYISYSLNKIVSYYEADVSITYRHSSEDIDSILTFSTPEELSEALLATMAGHSSGLTFTCSGFSVTADTVSSELEGLYYSNPEAVTYLPDAEINIYPTDADPCIVEILFSYPYTLETTQSRAESISESLNSIIASAGGLTGDELVSYLAATLRETVTFDYEREMQDDHSFWQNIYTAYGALVMNRAAGEGYAMAMKMFCDRYDIECFVVSGRLNNVSHSWNIIKLENGYFYHVDCSISDLPGTFLTDNEMSENYLWTQSSVPECNGPSLLPSLNEAGEDDLPAEEDIPPIRIEVPELPDISDEINGNDNSGEAQGTEEPDTDTSTGTGTETDTETDSGGETGSGEDIDGEGDGENGEETDDMSGSADTGEPDSEDIE